MSDASEVERWLPVPGFEGLYDVSDHGRVRSLARLVPHSRGGTQRLRERVLKPASAASDGRRRVILYGNGQELTAPISVTVLEAFVGPRPPGRECCHRDGDASNDRLSNLYWGTHSENMYDQVRHGMHHFTKRRSCPRGHLLAEPNLVASKLRLGHRNCLACNRALSRRAYAKRTGRSVDCESLADVFYREIMGSVAA